MSNILYSWVSINEIFDLPASGPEWASILSEANKDLLKINVGNQDNTTDSEILAATLVYAKYASLHDPRAEVYRSRVQAALMAAIGTEYSGGTWLSLSRNLGPLATAADLIAWDSPLTEQTFREWISGVRHANVDGFDSLAEVHEKRPNNWGTHAGASRLAIAIYLRDKQEILRCIQVLKGWLGDRTAYAGFDYGDLSWQSDESKPVGVNPRGATKFGFNVDGVLPDDQRRAGSLPGAWGKKENYAYEALQGILSQAVMLHKIRFKNVWQWSDSAILRGYRWLQHINNHPVNDPENGTDDNWQAFVLRRVYKTDEFPLVVPAKHGKAFGYTDWLFLSPNYLN